jgi:hypothetical protein
MATTYEVVDRMTGRVVSRPYTDRNRARRRADRLDLEYGAIRYYVREVVA